YSIPSKGGGGAGRLRRRDSDRVQVEVLLVREYLQNMLAGGNLHALLADPLECAPRRGVGHGDRAGHILSIDFGVEGAVCERAARPDFDVVLGAGRDVDGVGKPLPGLEVVHDVAAAQGVGGHDDVHVFGEPVGSALVTRGVVMVGNAFAAQVEILRLEASGNG